MKGHRVICLLVVTLVLNAVLRGNLSGGEPELPPARWQQEPHAYSSSTVHMAASPLGGGTAAEYRFLCAAGGGHSSDWQTDVRFRDTNLEPNTEYTYQLEVRGRRGGRTITSRSAPMTVRTRSDGRDHQYGHMAKIDAAFASGDIEITPLMITGDKDNRLNILILNRWTKGQQNAYNKAEMRDEFISDCQRVLNAFDPAHSEVVVPYPQYRNFFNVYAVWWADIPPYDGQNRQECIRWEEIQEIRNRIVLPWRREGRAWGTMMAMFNGDGGGGGAGRVRERRVGDAMIVGNEVFSFFHEFNHTAPGIPDEYCSSGMWGYGGETVSTTNVTERDRIRWRAWIEPGTPIPTPFAREYLGKVGLFEGGQHRWFSHYRPTARGCLMGAGSFHDTEETLCPVCRQQVVTACYQYVDVLENPVPRTETVVVQGRQTRRFSVQRVRPEPDTQRIEWRLNGRVIATDCDEVDVTFGALPEYELRCIVTDTTDLVRADPPYSFAPMASTKWTVRQAAGEDQIEPIRIRLTGRDAVFEGEPDGEIAAHVTGGCPPYVYEWQDGVATRNRESLTPGDYTLTVSDSQYQTASAEICIRQLERNKPRLVSEGHGDTWRVSVQGLASPSCVTCQWSTGATGSVIDNLSDGSYHCVIRHRNGTRLTRYLVLETPAEPMTVTDTRITPSCGGENNGSIAFSVTGGRPPYTFTWCDGTVLDEPRRCFLAPGDYTVSVSDRNLTTIVRTVQVGSSEGFRIGGLRFVRADARTVKIDNADPQYQYLWFDADFPSGVLRFPRGSYAGTYTDASGRTCNATGLVVTNKGGLYVNDKAAENDYGYWIHLACYMEGPTSKPVTYRISTSQDEPFAKELHVDTEAWQGEIAQGRMRLDNSGSEKGTVEMSYVSHPASVDEPVHTGTQFSPTRAGNFYVAAQDTSSGAVSLNRVGVAVAVGEHAPEGKPIHPNAVKSARILLWLDAEDMDADGRADTMLRRGSIIGWRSKGGGVGFRDFVNYLPNCQNGRPVASWDNIWLQSLEKPVTGYQTVIMVRRESSMSDEGAAPWRGLSDLIGADSYGRMLMTYGVSDAIGRGAVYLNGDRVDPFKTPMPEDFYLVTYEFPEPMDKPIHRTDGRWEGYLAECLILNGTLTDEERQGVEAYLYRKWIASVSLAR